MIAYYDFESKSGTKLQDRGPAKRHGSIVACAWVEGRFKGKGALEFKRPGDGVRINLPNQYQQLTLAAWLRMDALTGRTQAILTSDGFEPGDGHWQITSLGELAFGVRTNNSDVWQLNYLSPPVLNPLTIGRWNQICIVYDLKQKSVKHYINGEETSNHPIGYPQPITFGVTEIGNWHQEEYPQNIGHLIRNFCGRIDEVAIWNAALSSKEIEEFYLNSRP